MKKNLALLLCSLMLLGMTARAHAIKILANCPVGAPSSLIPHSQTTLGTETLLVCPFDPNDGGHFLITRDYQVTNNTGTPWTDYHFSLSLELPPGTNLPFPFAFQTPSLNPAIGTVVQDDGRHVSVFFAQPLTVGSSFTINMVFGQYDRGTATVSGTPSIPEPGMLAITALGLVGLGWRSRRT